MGRVPLRAVAFITAHPISWVLRETCGTLPLPIIPWAGGLTRLPLSSLITGHRADYGCDDKVTDSAYTNDNPSNVQPNLIHKVLLGDKNEVSRHLHPPCLRCE